MGSSAAPSWLCQSWDKSRVQVGRLGLRDYERSGVSNPELFIAYKVSIRRHKGTGGAGCIGSMDREIRLHEPLQAGMFHHGGQQLALLADSLLKAGEPFLHVAHPGLERRGQALVLQASAG